MKTFWLILVLIALWLLAILIFAGRAYGEGKKIITYSHQFIVAYNSILSPTEALKEQIKSIIITTAVKHNIDPELFLQIVECESGFNPMAKNSTSLASGLFQFLPSTWSSWGNGDVFSVKDNINAATRLFLARGITPWLPSVSCWQK